MKRYSISATALAVSLGVLVALPDIAQAQAPAPAPALEEVVVTAQKREEYLQDTPISLVALGSTQLENLGIVAIGSLGSNIPNLQLSPHPNSAATPRVFIRGVGNFDDQITQDPSVAVYIDGVYVGRNQGMGMEVADIRRIEVLRGPQGALYGRNATGGAINFVTQAPELGEWGFGQQFTIGRRDEFRSRTMLNIPAGDRFAARVSYLTSEKDGFIKNLGRGTGTYGAEDHEAMRADLLFQATDNLDIRYAYDRSRLKDSPYYLAPTTPGAAPRRPSRSHAGGQLIKRGDATTSGHQLTVNWRLNDTLTLRSITAHRDLDSYLYQDYFSGTGRPNTPFWIDSDIEQDQFSQEFHLLGDAFDGQLEYTLGLYYFQEDGIGRTVNWLPGFGIYQFSEADTDNEALAAFGQATYTPAALDRLHVTVGVRWSRDERRADLLKHNGLINFHSTDYTDVSAGDVLQPSVAGGSGKKKFNDVSPSLTVAFDLTDDINIYAKVVDGYKTGGFNVRASTIGFFEQGFDEETLRSYELGMKAQWLDNRLRTNLAVFEADYDDIQINAQTDLTNPAVADILNAGQATIRGAELEVTALLREGFTMSLQYGYLNARYDEVLDGFARNVTNNFEFVNAPRHSYTLDATWDIAATAIGLFTANVNYTWQDEKFITATTNFGEYKIDDYGLLHARLTLDEIPGLPAGSLKVSLWGRNLENKEYCLLNAPGFGTYRAWGEPRSYGVDLAYRF